MNLIPRHSLLDSWFDKDFPSFRLLPELRDDEGIFAVDIEETDKSYLLKADFPGLKKDEISVTVENNMLTLSAEHKEEKEEKHKGKVIRQERHYGKYLRSFSIDGIDEKGISAQFNDGVLTLEIPKAEHPKSKAKTIAIK
jgi:HSP20 family protein